ncbi:MAG: tetratricopeptide repeat protein [Fidelibacterota bacterium]|nr:MAG: tetratricopeptide repeat protein [Candidatus Neomarinimicrobiota bacterium]
MAVKKYLPDTVEIKLLSGLMVGTRAGCSIRFWILAVWCLILGPGAALFAQDAEDTTAVSSESSLLEQVYEHRISLFQDSLFLTHEQLDAANFMVRQLEQRADTLADSLVTAQDQVQQLADSLFRLFVLHDRVVIENRQNLERLSILSDSIAQSYRRENELRALNDSLLIILARTQNHLANVSSNQKAYSDTAAALRNTLEALRRELTVSEEQVMGMYEQLEGAMYFPEETAIDSAVDERLVKYLRELVDYRLETAGLVRMLRARTDESEIYVFKLDEFRQYLARAALLGHTPEALNLLARTYVEQDDAVRGILAYLKTVFIYPETEAGLQAMGQLEDLVENDGALGKLYYEVALNPDSIDVGEEEYYRFLNYLDHVRKLPNVTAREWFINEARQFLDLYPGIFQADEVLLWIAQAYHAQGQYHNEILTYAKIRLLHPFSRIVPRITYAMAEVTTDNLKEYTTGATRYELFREEFPNHEKAPQALFAQADIYENELRDYQRASDLFRELTDTYPEDALAPVSLFRLAEILHLRLASPTGALAVYEEILKSYYQEPETGIPALERLASISRDIRQYEAAVVYYLDIHQRYPEAQERAVAGILQAAEIYESQLKNLDATIHTLHLILDNYPDYPRIRSVQRRIQKLQDRRG